MEIVVFAFDGIFVVLVACDLWHYFVELYCVFPVDAQPYVTVEGSIGTIVIEVTENKLELGAVGELIL